MSLADVRSGLQQLAPRTRAILLLGLFAIIGLLIWHFLFIHNFSNAHPRSDQWRHIKTIVIPWASGEADAKIFWSNHHPNPLLHLYQIYIAGPLFDWNVRKDAYFSLVLHVFIYALLAAAFLRTAKDRSHPFLIFGLLATGLYFFCFQTTLTWVWTLVSLQSLGFLLGVMILVCLSRYGFSRDESLPKARQDFRITLALSFFTIFTVLMNFDYGVIFFLTALGAMILVAIFHQDKGLAQQLFIYALIGVVGIVLINWLLLPEEKPAPSLSILSLFKTSPELIKAHFYSLASAFWGESWFRDITIRGNALLVPILCITFTTIVFLSAAVAALVKGRRGLLMLGLMIYPALFSLAVFTARDAGDFTVYLSSARYATNFKFAWVGALLALTLFAVESEKFMPRKKWIISLLPVFVFAFLTGAYASGQAWSHAKNLRAAYDRDELMLYLLGVDDDADFTLSSAIVGSGRNNDEAIDFLVKNEFTVFHPEFRSGPVLREYKILKTEFEAGAGERFRLLVDSTNIPARRSDRKEACIDFTALSLDTPTRLDVTHVSDKRGYGAKLRLRGKDYRRVLTVFPGQSHLYVQPNSSDIRICSWAVVRLAEN